MPFGILSSVMVHFLPLFALAVVVVVVLKVIDYLRLKATLAGSGVPAATTVAELTERLGALERRVTDVQDVMITLSEQFDRWEQERSGRGAPRPANTETAP